jgi:hypothetical protein
MSYTKFIEKSKISGNCVALTVAVMDGSAAVCGPCGIWMDGVNLFEAIHNISRVDSDRRETKKREK